MLTKYVRAGDKIELRPVHQPGFEPGTQEEKVYYSNVQEILSESNFEAAVPTEKTKLILLPMGEKYRILFRGKRAMYYGLVVVTDRYKKDNMSIMRLHVVGQLTKYQQREYYRMECALPIETRELTEQERLTGEAYVPDFLEPDLPTRQGIMLDISGGGLRFRVAHPYDPGTLIWCNYQQPRGGMASKYEIIGKVLTCQEVENRRNVYEHRVQFQNLPGKIREEIIRFIFEEQRREQQNGKKNIGGR